MTKKKATLEQLERLCTEGRKDELKNALTLCRFDDLRKFLNALDVKVRSKQYAAYRTKEDHVQLLMQVLEKKATGGREFEVVAASPQKEEVVEQSSEEEEEEEEAGSSKEEPESEQSERTSVNQLAGLLDAGAQPPPNDADRVFLVQCINATSDVLTNVERKKEQVPGLKRTLTTELAYYVKRLKRIQEKDGDDESA